MQCVHGSSRINSGAPLAVHNAAKEVKKSTEPLGVSSKPLHHYGKSMLKVSIKQCEEVHVLPQITAEHSTQSLSDNGERESKHDLFSPSSSITINSEVSFY